jgi:hypothetical protein
MALRKRRFAAPGAGLKLGQIGGAQQELCAGRPRLGGRLLLRGMSAGQRAKREEQPEAQGRHGDAEHFCIG